jgi:hypothetical protein
MKALTPNVPIQLSKPQATRMRLVIEDEVGSGEESDRARNWRVRLLHSSAA